MCAKQSSWIVLVLVCLLCVPVFCRAADRAEKGTKVSLRASEEDMRRWRDAGFGLFVSWGPVSLTGEEIGWSRRCKPRGYHRSVGSIPVEVYDNLYKEFNPTKFNARQWVDIAKAAGMKYIVFTTKHWDGFCNFDSKLTEYKISNSPFRRDIVAELARACHEGGIMLGLYYCAPDMYHPDYNTNHHERYIEYMHGQLRELCTNYGQVDVIWFDSVGKTKGWEAARLVTMIRQLQPHVVVCGRGIVPDDYDDYGSAESSLHEFVRGDSRMVECCNMLGVQWSWKPDDLIKSREECVSLLVRCAGANGNFLLDVGPMPTGEIEPRQVERLNQIGQWLKTHGESIYGTRGGPFPPDPWSVSTYKGNKIYVHILDEDENPVLPPIDKKIVASSILTGGTPQVSQTDQRIKITVRKADREQIDTVVVLELDGPATDVKLGQVAPASLTAGKKFTGSRDKREVDLGKPLTIGRAALYIGSIRSLTETAELQYKDGDTWQTLAKGKNHDGWVRMKFDPVKTRFVRLLSDKRRGITEFQLFPPAKN